MYVCLCNRVTDHQIRAAAERGVATVDQLRDQLKVASCCGRCEDCARQVLSDAMAGPASPAAGLAAA